MKHFLHNHTIRRTLRVLIAFLLALCCNAFLATSNMYLLPISTLFVMYTATGSALYQGILRFITLFAAIFLCGVLLYDMSILKTYLYDVTIGSLLGIVINVVVLPDRVDVVFRYALIPILKAYTVYFSAIIALLLQRDFARAEKGKILLEKKLSRLPNWVLEKGFDVTLQKGHRYFLIKIGEMSELLFAMHHLARYAFDRNLLLKIRKPLIQCNRKVEHFINALITVLNLKKLTVGVEDFSNEIRKLEKNFKKSVPVKLELMDVEKDYVYLVEFIYDLKDLHDALMKVALALR